MGWDAFNILDPRKIHFSITSVASMYSLTYVRHIYTLSRKNSKVTFEIQNISHIWTSLSLIVRSKGDKNNPDPFSLAISISIQPPFESIGQTRVSRSRVAADPATAGGRGFCNQEFRRTDRISPSRAIFSLDAGVENNSNAGICSTSSRQESTNCS